MWTNKSITMYRLASHPAISTASELWHLSDKIFIHLNFLRSYHFSGNWQNRDFYGQITKFRQRTLSLVLRFQPPLAHIYPSPSLPYEILLQMRLRDTTWSLCLSNVIFNERCFDLFLSRDDKLRRRDDDVSVTPHDGNYGNSVSCKGSLSTVQEFTNTRFLGLNVQKPDT